jgi:hypothetical protein
MTEAVLDVAPDDVQPVDTTPTTCKSPHSAQNVHTNDMYAKLTYQGF